MSNDKKLSVLYQVVDAEGNPVGLYAVPQVLSDKFEELFEQTEQKAWEIHLAKDDETEFHDTLDETLWADHGIDRMFIEDEIQSKYINASF